MLPNSKKNTFLWHSQGSNQYRLEGLWFVCLFYDGSTRGLIESNSKNSLNTMDLDNGDYLWIILYSIYKSIWFCVRKRNVFPRRLYNAHKTYVW